MRKVIYKRGATIENKHHIGDLLQKLKSSPSDNPIVYIWLGTCEITRKVNRIIETRKYPYQSIEFFLTKYREVKKQIQDLKPGSTVLFIDCPYYSITRANNKYAIRREGNERPKPNKKPSLVINKFKKNRLVQLSTEIDNQVCNQVDYYNRQIKLINRNTATPRLSQDLIISNKSKKDRRIEKLYQLSREGVIARRNRGTSVDVMNEEPWECKICSTVYKDPNAKLLECQRCKDHFCIKCLNKSKPEYDLLSKTDSMWFCVPCRKTVEEHIVTDLKIEARSVDTKCDETRVREIVEESIIKNSCDKDMIREIAKDEATKTGDAVHKKNGGS
ncbi:Hypothetical predicted protein [Mytilus galloprovincialis]|uniref:PHD-type domain-containing protein n=1 Tax=Mytilus galloprovincialis TaxID=29158 RepID=A0A8B6CT40_MYTGA|nr:Hypothetical predicted protein [Mytilus galloprovincialis]